ncbi:MAG TPA: hypothetical protein P5170_02605 [Candidatus Syntrophosphaera sp.]|nr:hypothetical protein [Candidatus Syntrophosphaera sp.]
MYPKIDTEALDQLYLFCGDFAVCGESEVEGIALKYCLFLGLVLP